MAYFAPKPWPKPLADEAYCGLAGEIVNTIEPHTEADPAALMIHFLVAFGNVIGRHCHFRVGGARHYTNLFAVIVGETARSRKETAWAEARSLFRGIDPAWLQDRIRDGLSSGEGLIWAVRNPTPADHDSGAKD